MATRERIDELERRMAALEPTAKQRAVPTSAVRGYAEAFLEALPEMDAYVEGNGADPFAGAALPESPTSIESALATLRTHVDVQGINPASGGHLGYIPGGGVYYSALGDFLADATNRYAGVAFASPGAVRLEKQLIRWMANLVGYPSTAAGDLTSGGSVANLMAVVAARDAHHLHAKDFASSVIYLTRHAHHCVDKAIRIAGLVDCPRRFVDMDERYRMDSTALAQSMREDRASGLHPWLVVASAGTTDVGAVDPIPAIAEVAKEAGAWLHVDAAYGGFFLLCEEGQRVVRGLELADSVVMDPHKGLFLPYGSGALLVRDASALHRAHYYHANYMQDVESIEGELSPADLSPELSRPFRGLRLWLPLQLAGLGAFRAALEEKLLLARYFHERLSSVAGFEVGPYPELSVVTYRYVPRRGDADDLNEKLARAVRTDGKLFISSTRVEGRFLLRLAVLNFRSHRRHVDYLIDLLAREAARLEAEAGD